MRNLLRLFRLTCAGFIAAALMSSLGAAPLMAEARIALVIGNSNYGSDMGSLKNPANDAKLISKSLSAVGFKVTTLLDADQRTMKRAISDFGGAVSDAGPESVALFFYAGHGIQVDGTNYLVPVGARIERKGDVDLEAIEAEALLKQLEYAGAKISIVVLDACRNNPLPRSMRGGDRGLARMDAPTGSFVAYSTAPGDVAVDGEGTNSPFAAALADEVNKPGESVEEVFRSVRRKVMGATGERQVPWDSSSLTAPFYFVPASQQVASAPAAQTAQPSAAATGGSNQLLSADMLMWESIKDSSKPADFSAYLKRFPDGVYSDLARNRLTELSGSGSANTVAAVVPEPVQPAPAPAPEPQPAPATEVAALPSSSTASTAAPTSMGLNGRTWVVSSSLKNEIDKYFAKVDPSSKQVRSLAIARDGTSAGIGIASPKVASGWGGGGDSFSTAEAANEQAIKKCGGKTKCQIAFIEGKKQGNFDLVYADGSNVGGAPATTASQESQAPTMEVTSVEPTTTTSRSTSGGSEWVVSASLKDEIDDYLAKAAKPSRQLRALAIAKDGSHLGIGLFTPKVESGWGGGGGEVHDDLITVGELALKKCGGKEVCDLAYIGDKKQGGFELAYQ